jgi:hypothetical protein
MVYLVIRRVPRTRGGTRRISLWLTRRPFFSSFSFVSSLFMPSGSNGAKDRKPVWRTPCQGREANQRYTHVTGPTQGGSLQQLPSLTRRLRSAADGLGPTEPMGRNATCSPAGLPYLAGLLVDLVALALQDSEDGNLNQSQGRGVQGVLLRGGRGRGKINPRSSLGLQAAGQAQSPIQPELNKSRPRGYFRP